MILAALVALSQVADGLAFALAVHHGSEMNPYGAALYAAGGVGLVLIAKAIGAATLGLGAYALPHRRRLWIGLAAVGYVGAATGLLALL